MIAGWSSMWTTFLRFILLQFGTCNEAVEAVTGDNQALNECLTVRGYAQNLTKQDVLANLSSFEAVHAL